MNYRLLFFMAFLILGVGLAGLFMMDKENQVAVAQQAVAVQSEPEVVYKDVTITTVTVNRDIVKGTLLTPEDYQTSTMTLKVKEGEDNKEKTPQMGFDMNEAINSNKNGSIEGFVVKENLKKDSMIRPEQILSYDHEDFVAYALDDKKEVAYSIKLGDKTAYLLTSLKSGMIVSLYAQIEEESGGRLKGGLIKLIDKVTILRVEKPQLFKEQEQQSNSPKEGNVILKLLVEDLQKIYQLPLGVKILPIPATDEPVGQRGLLIRQLRGN